VLVLLLVLSWGPQCIEMTRKWRKRWQIAQWQQQRSPPPRALPMPHVRQLQSRTRIALGDAIVEDFAGTQQMQEICEYSLDGGKLVRAMLTQIVADPTRLFSGKDDQVPHDAIEAATLQAALSIEYIHAASLVLDDEMDGDEERRGKPSAYVKYGSTASQLAALQLMTTAFVKTVRTTEYLKVAYGDVRGNELGMAMFDTVSRNLQLLGMGQYLDLYPTNAPWAKLGEAIGQQRVAHVEDVIRKKTVTLFEVSFVYGWMLRNGGLERLDEVRELAHAFGMLFQIADDCDDYDMDVLRAGKNTVMSFVIRHGARKTQREALRLQATVRTLCTALAIRTTEIDELLAHLNSSVAHFCARNE
jgi:geranylgeranyl diphosphate synthase type II